EASSSEERSMPEDPAGAHLDEQRVRSRQVPVAPGGSAGLERNTQRESPDRSDDHLQSLDRWPVLSPPLTLRFSPVTKPAASRTAAASRMSPDLLGFHLVREPLANEDAPPGSGFLQVLLRSPAQLVQGNRQIAHALAGGVIDCVGDRRRNPDNADFAYTLD